MPLTLIVTTPLPVGMLFSIEDQRTVTATGAPADMLLLIHPVVFVADISALVVLPPPPPPPPIPSIGSPIGFPSASVKIRRF